MLSVPRRVAQGVARLVGGAAGAGAAEAEEEAAGCGRNAAAMEGLDAAAHAVEVGPPGSVNAGPVTEQRVSPEGQPRDSAMQPAGIRDSAFQGDVPQGSHAPGSHAGDEAPAAGKARLADEAKARGGEGMSGGASDAKEAPVAHAAPRRGRRGVRARARSSLARAAPARRVGVPPARARGAGPLARCAGIDRPLGVSLR